MAEVRPITRCDLYINFPSNLTQNRGVRPILQCEQWAEK